MPSLKDIRIRIDSTKNTQQITKAMKMVSAAKLRRAQSAIVNLRPYAKRLRNVIVKIANSGRIEHPLLNPVVDPKKVLLVVLTSDRGLCGGFNNNINKYAWTFYQENKSKYDQLDCLTIGRKASEFFKKRGIQPVDTILNLSKEINYPMAARIAEHLMNEYIDGSYDAIYIIYNEFKSAISQIVTLERLFPINLEDISDEEKQDHFSDDLIFEPAPEEMINELMVRYYAVQVYRCMAESVAAEHGARMASMESATKNAGEMIRQMTLTYNKVRQASITTELIEITSGAEALKG